MASTSSLLDTRDPRTRGIQLHSFTGSGHEVPSLRLTVTRYDLTQDAGPWEPSLSTYDFHVAKLRAFNTLAYSCLAPRLCVMTALGHDGEVNVPIEAIQVIDSNVVKNLPPGTHVTGITAHGASFWTRTAKLSTNDANGISKNYFLKTSYGDVDKGMMESEFIAMQSIYATVPDFTPQPIGWGSYTSMPDVHYFLSEFHDMTDGLPSIENFPAKLAELHKKCTSPHGKFGFNTTTYHGRTPLVHGWADTWEEFFSTRTRKLLELEREVQGSNEEIDVLVEPFFAKVVPRLLRPLETGGKSIKPCLVHGDLWHGNAAMDRENSKPIVFDAACLYAHNEYDLGVWRQPWNKLGQDYMDQYHKHFPVSEPIEDHDDRNALYAVRVDMLDSILYKTADYRSSLIKGMRALVNKFPTGLDDRKEE